MRQQPAGPHLAPCPIHSLLLANGWEGTNLKELNQAARDLADDLLDHSSKLISAPPVADIDCRRAVSASYYAVFHLIAAAVASQVSPQDPVGG